MSESIARLLAELDPLPYPDRMRALAAQAAERAATGTLAGLMAELRAGDTNQRRLAITLAAIAGDAAAVAAALTDRDQRVRAIAVRVSLRAGWLDAPALVALVQDAPADLRRLVYKSLRGARRPELADALVEEVRARYGDTEAARLLPGCSAKTVERLLPDLDHAVANWTALAARHGDIVLDHAERILPGVHGPARDEWWRRCGAGVLSVGDRRAERVLDLLERFAPSTYLPGDLRAYGVLAAADAPRVVGLLTSPGRAPWLRRTRLPAAVLDRLGRRDPGELVEMGERLRDVELELARVLDAVAPGRRGQLFDAATAAVDTSQAMWCDALLEVLPRDWREREARRILTIAAVRDDEASVLHFTAHLLWDDAAPALDAATRRADPDDRAAAYELLLAAARRSADPAAAATVVEQLGRLRNEQDPVRARALIALSRMPQLLRADSVEALTRLVVHATEARDASGASLSALSTLAVAVVRHHPGSPQLLQWASQTIERLFGSHHVPPLGRLDTALRHGQERDLLAAVQPWIEAGMARGNFQRLLAVAQALGRRAWHLSELQALLRRAIDPGVVSSIVRQAVTLWLEDPSTRSQRVEEVLLLDSSTVTIAPVWHTICSRRTDLLDLVLIGPGPAGKFLTAGTRWVPHSAYHVDRWLPRQQQAFAELQSKVAADAGAHLSARAAAIGAAARIPGFGWPAVARYLDSTNTVLAEAALGALAWTDRPAEALPILLAHADGDTARVAVYAATRAARFIPPSRLTAELAGIATGRGKVTARKEAVRLLAQFGDPAALDLLLTAWRQAGQHRDVRAAIVSAARRRLDRAQVWNILNEAADGSREEILALLAKSAADTAERDRCQYAALVARTCGKADRVVANAAWAHLPEWAPWTPDLTDLVVSAVSDLDNHANWPTVAAAVCQLLNSAPFDGQQPALHAALDELARLDAADRAHGNPARDRPARRRIDALIDQATSWSDRAGPDAPREPVRAAGRSLAQHPGFIPQAARLLTHLARLDVPAPEELTTGLTEIAELVANRPVVASHLADALITRLRKTAGSWDPATVAVAAATLAGRGDTASGLFAVALAHAGRNYGWTPTWRELVQQLREHDIADVRTAAFDLTMARP